MIILGTFPGRGREPARFGISYCLSLYRKGSGKSRRKRAALCPRALFAAANGDASRAGFFRIPERVRCAALLISRTGMWYNGPGRVRQRTSRAPCPEPPGMLDSVRRPRLRRQYPRSDRRRGDPAGRCGNARSGLTQKPRVRPARAYHPNPSERIRRGRTSCLIRRQTSFRIPWRRTGIISNCTWTAGS